MVDWKNVLRAIIKHKIFKLRGQVSRLTRKKSFMHKELNTADTVKEGV
jgi:hypothetical protein